MTVDKKQKQNNGKVHHKDAKTEKSFDIVGDFIEDVWEVMTPAMVDRLKSVLTEDFGLSKNDADRFIQSQRQIRRQRICLKTKKKVVFIGARNQWIRELSRDIANQIANFIVGLLLSDRSDRTKKLTDQILSHLCEVTGESTTVDTADSRIERAMVVIADRMSVWVDETIKDMEQECICRDISRKFSNETLGPIKSMEASSFSESIGSYTDDELLPKETKRKSKLYSLTIQDDESELSEINSELEKKSADETIDSEDQADEESEHEPEEEIIDEETELEDSESETEAETEEETPVTEEPESEEEEETVEEEEETVEEEKETVEEEENFVEEKNVEEEENLEEEEENIEEEETNLEEEERREDVEEEEEISNAEEEKEEGEEEIEQFEEEEHEGEGEEEFCVPLEISKGSLFEEEESKQTLLSGDILDLLKEDIKKVPKVEDESNRQRAMKDIIDKRFKNIFKTQFERSVDTLIKYDIDEAASIVANWVENILALAGNIPKESPFIKGEPVFEIKRREGSELEVVKLSSTPVAQKVAEIRGLEQSYKTRKVPKTISPMNVQTAKDWSDWIGNAANVGEKWGKWLNIKLLDVEKKLERKERRSSLDMKEDWYEWKNETEHEALKWLVEKRRLCDEAALWNKKLRTSP